MTNNNAVTSFRVNNRTDFMQCLSHTEARNPCSWNFTLYDFERQDVSLVRQLNCHTLALVRTSYSKESKSLIPRKEVLSSFLNLKGVETLGIDIAIDQPLIRSLDLHLFVYRASISNSLVSVYLALPKELNCSLAEGLKYASNITNLRISFPGTVNVKYMFRYFSSTKLKQVAFQNASSEDCFAVVREKRVNGLEVVVVWNGCATSSKLTSKCLCGVLLKRSRVSELYGIFIKTRKTALSEYQQYLFKKSGIKFE